jgi:putative transposase
VLPQWRHRKEVIPVSVKVTFDVKASIAECVAEGKEDFWAAAFRESRELLTRLIEAGLEAEMETFVGAGWHERNASTRRTLRGGARPRRFTVLGHDLRLRVPRARIAGFRSEFLGHRERRHEEFDRWVIEAYTAGASTRETTAELWNMFGTSVSPTTVSHLLRKLDEERERFQSRRLADEYLYLVLDAMYVHVLLAPAPGLRGTRRGEAVEQLAVLLVRGIKADGTRELIDFRVAEGERELAWEHFLRNLFDRGLEGAVVRSFVHDGSEGLEHAIQSVYGPLPQQRCICHKLANVWDAVTDKENHESIRNDASGIYDAETAREAKERLAAFCRNWRTREPSAVATMRRQFDATLTYFDIPLEHRTWMRTTNPLERYIRELRRRTRPMGTFQGLLSCQRLLFVAVKKLSNDRRNAIPYSLWTSQPAYGTKRRSTSPRPRPHLDALRKEIYLALRKESY